MPPSRAELKVDSGRDRTNGGISKQRTRVSNILVSAAANKDNLSPASSNPPAGPITGIPPSIPWYTQSGALLNQYRLAYRLEAPSCFHSTLTAAVLTCPGIGRRSPTMLKQVDKRRRIPKEQLALAVRKHFNGSAVNESDVLVDFMYAVKTKDRKFKVKFAPGKR